MSDDRDYRTFLLEEMSAAAHHFTYARKDVFGAWAWEYYDRNGEFPTLSQLDKFSNGRAMELAEEELRRCGSLGTSLKPEVQKAEEKSDGTITAPLLPRPDSGISAAKTDLSRTPEAAFDMIVEAYYQPNSLLPSFDDMLSLPGMQARKCLEEQLRILGSVESSILPDDEIEDYLLEWHPAHDQPSFAAEALARGAHAGQTDKNGQPYITHLERVVSRLKRRFPDASPAEIEAAWLHDVLEDTTLTSENLLERGILPEAVRIVQLLTKPEGQVTYLDLITELCRGCNQSAIRVKLADNEDNSDPARIQTEQDAQRIELKYRPARLILEDALARGSSHEPS